MTSLLAVGFASVLVLLAPYLAGRLFDRRAPSRTVAMFHLLALVGAATLPLILLVCLSLINPDRHHGWCPPVVIHAARWGAVALGSLYLVRLGWAAALAVRATRRISSDAVDAAQEKVRIEHGDLLIVPVDRPIAYATGGSSKRVVVSRGLLSLLNERERTAAVAHEIAHIRLGHHRLLMFGQVLNSAFGFALPPVRTAFASFRRELEVIADDEAAAVVRDRSVVASALAKVASAGTPPVPAPALGNFEDLAYRIERLIGPSDGRDRRVLAGAGVALMVSSMTIAYCAAFHPSLWTAGIAACASAFAVLGHKALARPAEA